MNATKKRKKSLSLGAKARAILDELDNASAYVSQLLVDSEAAWKTAYRVLTDGGWTDERISGVIVGLRPPVHMKRFAQYSEDETQCLVVLAGELWRGNSIVEKRLRGEG